MATDLQSRLSASVSPLQDGIRPLEVGGYRPPGRETFRPSRTAAVLVPVIQAEVASVVLTTRSRALAQHAGQVSFPGGAADPDDASAVATALREAREEIGLTPALVKPLGFLDRYDTISDFRILPVVGWIDGRPGLAADGVEVDEVFEVPVSTALDPASYQTRRIERDGREYTIHSLDWEGRLIWGATAAILLNLAERMARLG